MNEYSLDFLIADAMARVDALIARGTPYNNIAIVVTPSVYRRIARRSDYQWSENFRISGSGYYGRYHGFDIYTVESTTEEDMCFPAFYFKTNDTLPPIHPGEYLIFGNNEELYKTDDGVTIRDSGMRVAREVQCHMVDPITTATISATIAATSFDERLFTTTVTPSFDSVQYEWRPTYLNPWLYDNTRVSFKKLVPEARRARAEPELQPTPELDEYIEQFRKNECSREC